MNLFSDFVRNFSFAEPLYLYLFVPWLVLIGFWILVAVVRFMCKPRKSYGSKYPILGRMKLWGCCLLALACMILAVAKPNWSGSAPEISRGNIQVVILWDNSFSQVADDLRPSRLEIAKREILNIEAMLHDGDKAALFTFGKDSHDRLDLTKDLGTLFDRVSRVKVPKNLLDETIFDTNFAVALENIYQSLDIQDKSDEGKKIDAAYNPKKRTNRIVLVFSDGDDEYVNYKAPSGMVTTETDKKEQAEYLKRLKKALAECKKRGLKIYPVGIGTTRGVSWVSLLKKYKHESDFAEALEKEWQGQTTRLDKANLLNLARETGVQISGRNWTVESPQESAKDYIKSSIDSNRKALVEIVETKNDQKLWQYLLLGALLFFALGVATYPHKGYFRKKVR